ncbi:MAG: substrate binding domain-containing protein, partial [Deltaproteobacteria bacterium]|nr:substrate binding domain-containing protein [Deltaproteobacteria bacterium]
TLPFILAPLVVPRLARLGAQHPRLAFHLHLTDRIARLADENVDVAIRVGELAPSSLVARHLRATRWVTVASPGYLALRPPPERPADLATHNCLRFLAPNGRPRDWTFAGAAQRVDGNLVIDHGESLVAAARAGMGICQVLDFMVGGALRDGALVEVLADFAAAGPAIHAVATPARVRSANVRAFLRFLGEVLGRAMVPSAE